MGSYSIYPIVYIYAVLFYVLIKGRVGFSLFLLTLFLFAALRGDVGNDTCGYQGIYNSFNLAEKRLHFGRIEPVFALINVGLNYIGLGYQSLFVTIAAIQSVVYFKVYQYVNSNTRWLLVFLVLMYYYAFHINTLRYGLAIIIFSLAFVFYLNGRKKIAIFVAVLSIGIHVAAAPLLLLFRRDALKFIIISIFSLLLYDLFIDKGLVVAKLAYIDYLLNYNLSFNASLGWYIVRKLSLLVAIFWLVRDKYYKYLFIFFTIGIGTLDAYMPIIGRFSEAYVFILIVYLSYIGIKKEKIIFLLPFILLSAYSHIVYPILKGDEASAKIRQNSTKQNVNRSTAKYSFFFEDDQPFCINLSK